MSTNWELWTTGIVVVALWGLWGWAIVASRRPLQPRPNPSATTGDESPAVVEFLVNRWRGSDAGATATLYDLVARGHLEFAPGDHGPSLRPTRTTPGEPSADDLVAHEQRVLDLVNLHSVHAPVPVAALSDGTHSRDWLDAFHAEVSSDARMRGLSRAAFGGSIAVWAVGAGLVGAVATTMAVIAAGLPLRAAFPVTMGAAIITATIALGRPDDRPTASGRATAGAWISTWSDLRCSTAPSRAHAYAIAIGVIPLPVPAGRLSESGAKPSWFEAAHWVATEDETRPTSVQFPAENGRDSCLRTKLPGAKRAASASTQ